MTTVLRPTARTLVWMPFVLLMAALAVSVLTGRAPVSLASATDIRVTGSIDADIYVDLAGCAASAVDIGELLPGDPWKTAQDNGGGICAVEFGTTNHAAGTSLSMLEDPAAPASPADAMKCVGGACAGDSIADYDAAAEPAGGTSAFGTQLLSAGGIATATWDGEPAVVSLQDSASVACTTPGIGSGTCSFTWGATAAADDIPGAYQALARMVVLAR